MIASCSDPCDIDDLPKINQSSISFVTEPKTPQSSNVGTPENITTPTEPPPQVKRTDSAEVLTELKKNLAEAERDVFRRRWKAFFGQELGVS